MKRVLIFIGLKIVEIGGAWLIIIKCPFWLGLWVHTWTEFFCTNHAEGICDPIWAMGFVTMFLPIVALIIGFCIFMGTRYLIEANWNWANVIKWRLENKN